MSRKPGAEPKLTMKEVAERAGVALSSVSRVLSGHPAVSESLRQRVMQAVTELDYEPDYTAMSLRSGSTKIVGFLLRDIASPLFSDIVKAAEEDLRRVGYSMLLTNSGGDPDRDAAHIRLFARRRVDGIILSLSSENHRDTMTALKNLRVPFVLVDRQVQGIEAGAVLSDHMGGVRAATRHLLEQGHRRIALITGPNEVFASRERLRGYKAGLRSASIRIDQSLVRLGSYDSGFGYEQCLQLLALSEPPTAVLAGGPQVSWGVLRALQEQRVRLGRDIAVIACDRAPHTEVCEPPLTIVDRDAAEIGRVSAQLLLDEMQSGRQAQVRRLPTELVVRGSSAVPVDPGRRRRGRRPAVVSGR